MHWITTFQPKLVTLILVLAGIFLEWRKGYFKKAPFYLRQLKPVPLLGKLALFSCLALALSFSDPSLLKTVQGFQHPLIDRIIDFGGALGRNINPWLLIMIGYLLGLALPKIPFSEKAFGTLLSAALAALSASVLKFTLLRARPYGELGPFSFFNLGGLTGDHRVFHSFPSGDVAVVAGIAGYWFYFLKKGPFRWLVWLLPLTTAVSRMTLNKHWPSDTVFPIGLGAIAGQIIIMWETARSQNTQSKP